MSSLTAEVADQQLNSTWISKGSSAQDKEVRKVFSLIILKISSPPKSYYSVGITDSPRLCVINESITL